MSITLVLGGTVGLLLVAVIWLARREGRRSAEADAAGTSVERAKNGLEIDETVARLSGDELDRELRKPERD